MSAQWPACPASAAHGPFQLRGRGANEATPGSERRRRRWGRRHGERRQGDLPQRLAAEDGTSRYLEPMKIILFRALGNSIVYACAFCVARVLTKEQSDCSSYSDAAPAR